MEGDKEIIGHLGYKSKGKECRGEICMYLEREVPENVFVGNVYSN